MNFDQAFDQLFKNEGGYVNNIHDPGGETKYGISKRSYPEEDIPNLTRERVKVLYRRDFWGPCGAETLPAGVRFEVFDLAVNTSARGNPKQALKLLQRAALMPEYEVDGVLGPKTLMAVGAMSEPRLLRRLQGLRIRFYTKLGAGWWDQFGKGVMNRIADNMLEV